MNTVGNFLHLIHSTANFDRSRFIRALGGNNFHDETTNLHVDDFGDLSAREFRLCLPLLLTCIGEQGKLIAHNDVNASIILNRPFMQYLRNMDEDQTFLGELKARNQLPKGWLAPILADFSQTEIVAAINATSDLADAQMKHDGQYFIEELTDLKAVLGMALGHWERSS